MSEIKYITGDALEPLTDDVKLIVHICNDAGGWGKGFVLAINRKWSEPQESYRRWFRSQVGFELGMCMGVTVEEDNIHVINMIAQHGYDPRTKPIRYGALETCLEKVAKAVHHFRLMDPPVKASVHMPRIGCGLAGGEWSKIEKIIERTLIQEGIDTYVYTLPDDESWK